MAIANSSDAAHDVASRPREPFSLSARETCLTGSVTSPPFAVSKTPMDPQSRTAHGLHRQMQFQDSISAFVGDRRGPSRRCAAFRA
jgi:hypothetical protein